MTYLIDLGSLVTALVAIAGAIAGLHRYVVKPTMERIRALQELVEHQLQPNGGKSIRDAVDRIEGRLDAHIAESSKFVDEQSNRRRIYDPESVDGTDAA